LWCRADDFEPRDRGETLLSVHTKLVLMARDIRKAERAEPLERCTEADRIGDAPGSRFEASGWWLVRRLLEGDVRDHVSAALPRRHRLKDISLAVHDADAGRSEDL